MKLTKESIKRIIKEELDAVMNEASGDPEYQEEYDLVANNIKTQRGFLQHALQSLESSFNNRFYDHGKGPRIGIYLSMINKMTLNGNQPDPNWEGTPLGGDIRSHVEQLEQKIAQDRSFLTPAGNGRLDALLDHLKQSY
tara:strand:+ start:765 stop:1181 length:417 start_codon:yes stop_codon:yes gene_type:complete